MKGVGHVFDLVVIGTGIAAGVVAHKCRRAGWSVAVIDSRPFGGTCALRGCDPKKVLVGAAEAVDQLNRLRGRGLGAEDLRIEWPELIRFKRGLIEAVPSEREDGFLKAGIATFHGRTVKRSIHGLLEHEAFRPRLPASRSYEIAADACNREMREFWREFARPVTFSICVRPRVCLATADRQIL